MSNEDTRPVWLSWLKNGGFTADAPALELRDHLFYLDLNLDVESQLIAIHGLLRRNRQADQATVEKIREIEEHARTLHDELNEQAVSEWIDRLHHSVYQDAAHSMAAIGMLAPLVESVFAQSFQAIGKKFFPPAQPLTMHVRWHAAHQVQWDCHKVFRSGKTHDDLVSGICELADATGLSSRLPPDLKPVLSALFGYRNKMFHLGFEWPMSERVAFAKRIADENWPPEWFSKATQGDEPWIFYMSSQFIDHVVMTLDRVLDGFAAFVRDELLPKLIALENSGGQEGNCGTPKASIS